jgi:cyclophilin family peptidyl-prolyl cis-trans isomerase
LLLFLPRLIGDYQQELQIREKEKQADDLPRVEIVTSSGKMVVELFENEAPETVANFISLVESGHYDNTLFHRVIPNFMAQCGGFSENNSVKRIGYTINDEFKNANFRRHFSGSLSMANTGKPNSGQAQFFINLAPTPFLDGKHTVFGTVIEGAATYQRIALTHKLSETNEEEPVDSALPDKILSAKVLRKRDHVYKPTKAREQSKEVRPN